MSIYLYHLENKNVFLLVRDEYSFMHALMWCLCSGALLKAIVLVGLPQLGISALLLAVTSLSREENCFSPSSITAFFPHKKMCKKLHRSAEIFSSQKNTLTYFSLDYCIHNCLITGILSQNFKIMCFSVSQFTVNIFAIIFSRWHKIQRFGFFFCVDFNNWFKSPKSS